MADLYRTRVNWAGVIVGAGVTTFYTTAIPDVAGIKSFFTGIKSLIPVGVTWTIKGSGDKINDADGVLTGAWSAGSDVTEVSSAAANLFAAPAGALLRLFTTTIVNGHRVQGRVFMVPMAATAYGLSGTIQASAITTLQTAGNTLISGQSSHLAVWSRPRKARAAVGSRPAVAAAPGSTALVTGVQVPATVAVLRSRRD